jgi:hypothetical protein
MALFESYERRIDQINAVLNSYGISSIEEAEKITKDAGLDVYDQRKSSQSVSRTLAGHTQLVQQSQSKKDVEEQQTLQQQSERDFRHSVFLDQLLITVR